MKFGVTMFPNNLGDVASDARLADEKGFDRIPAEKFLAWLMAHSAGEREPI